MAARPYTNEAVHLTGAFHLAGFRRVIGTLWPVADEATAELCADFYRRLTENGAEPPEPDRAPVALHWAVRELRRRHSGRAHAMGSVHVQRNLTRRCLASGLHARLPPPPSAFLGFRGPLPVCYTSQPLRDHLLNWTSCRGAYNPAIIGLHRRCLSAIIHFTQSSRAADAAGRHQTLHSRPSEIRSFRSSTKVRVDRNAVLL